VYGDDHLNQHLHFAQFYLMRLPNITSYGAGINYTLPRLMSALIVDQLTSCYGIHILSGSRRIDADAALLSLDYTTFSIRPTLETQQRLCSAKRMAVLSQPCIKLINRRLLTQDKEQNSRKKRRKRKCKKRKGEGRSIAPY
jgi:hypothetical protein